MNCKAYFKSFHCVDLSTFGSVLSAGFLSMFHSLLVVNPSYKEIFSKLINDLLIQKMIDKNLVLSEKCIKCTVFLLYVLIVL